MFNIVSKLSYMLNLSFRQQVLTGFTISLLFVLLSAVSSYLSIKDMEESVKWQNHTHEVINLTQQIETELLNSESGLRGYIITQKAAYLTPYSKFSTKILSSISELGNLVNDNPVQHKKADSLEFYAKRKLLDMQSILNTNEVSGKAFAEKKIFTDKGKYYKDKMLLLGGSIISTETMLLKQRALKTENSSKRTVLVVLVSAFIIFCLILFLSSYIKRTFDEQKLTEEKILESHLQLESLSAENEEKNWLLSGAASVNEGMRGQQEFETLSTNIITRVCKYINAPVGAFYLANRKIKSLKFTGGYAYKYTKGTNVQYVFGEGLIGQAALEQKPILLTDVPTGYLNIASGLGSADPSFIYIMPILFESKTLAVLEIGMHLRPTPIYLLFLKTIAENIGVTVDGAVARVELRTLFDQTQQQTEELESQQEELRITNEELIYKTEQLQASEEELRVQQEELRQTNAELEEKAQQLEERNLSINQAKEAIGLKAEELEMSSKYKSEFLANMSHELRTPLNSILILARILKENKPENLNDDQIKYAGVIHNAGSDLLSLINDILDLSKIESGAIDLQIESVRAEEITVNMESLFSEIAKSKKIEFKTIRSKALPQEFKTDLSRMEQIMKNLLSNAFKFTPENGRIILSIDKATFNTQYYSEQLKNCKQDVIAFTVQDSGIGIPEEKQKLIFEAFQQADGSTSRKYGGTGLGLSISKELAFILGGEIQVHSIPGEGSSFTLYLPENHIATDDQSTTAKNEIEAHINPFTPATQSSFKAKEQLTLLIVEDDIVFAEVLKDYAIEKASFQLLQTVVIKGLSWQSFNFLMRSSWTSCSRLWMDGPS
jgi:signal transduction histidine kinase/CHASE3 domain sensor protein